MSIMAREAWSKQEENEVEYSDFFKMVEDKLYDNRKSRIKSERSLCRRYETQTGDS